ncbi:MAG: GNAT family N-acetyltransferase [Kofleriaceae bacterium]
MGDLSIAPIVDAHLDRLVDIHVAAFPRSTITRFGREAARRYYRWLMHGPHDAAVMGAWRGQDLLGFCAAGVFRGAMNGFLRKNRLYLARRIALRPWLALDSLIRDRLVTAAKITLRYSRARPRQGPPPSPSFGILSIATHPTARGSGAGRALMMEAEARAKSTGHSRIVLTVAPDNERAIRFYEQLGWTRISESTGGWAGAMQREI